MKLRIKGNSIRLRLLKSEVEALSEHGYVSDEVLFPSRPLFYSLLISDEVTKVEARYEGDRIMTILPRNVAEGWINGEDISIEGYSGGINILVEKDLVCVGRPEDPDNADAFDLSQ